MICNFICTFAQKNRTLHYIAYTSKTGNKAQHSSVYKRVVRQCKKTADPQMAHLVFADTRANAQKNQKSHFLPTHGQTNRIKKVTL